MYKLLTKENVVKELIPDFHPAFPDIPIEKRYPPAFVASLIHVDDDTDVKPSMVYDKETGLFAYPAVTYDDEQDMPEEQA